MNIHYINILNNGRNINVVNKKHIRLMLFSVIRDDSLYILLNLCSFKYQYK